MENKPKKVIAFFDLDGTITHTDTLIAFLRFDRGLWKLLVAIFRLLPLVLKRVPASQLKEYLFSLLYKNKDITAVLKKGDEFAIGVLPGLVYKTAQERIKWHQSNGHEVCIVTASSPIWIASWAKQSGLQLIGTEYEILDNKFTGHYLGENCKGEEKVKRICSQYDLNQYNEVYAYGDTPGDKPMLNLANHSYYKPFS